MDGRLTRMLVECGDNGEIKRGMDGIVAAVLRDSGALKSAFTHGLIACVVEVPLKASIYGCLVGLVNLKDAVFAASVVSTMLDVLDEAIAGGDFRSAKLLLRFFAELVNSGVITGSAFLDLAMGVLAIIDNTNNTKPQLVDAIVFCVLGALPWASHHLYRSDPEGLQRLTSVVDAYMTRRRDSIHFGPLGLVFDALKVYRDCPKTEPYDQIDKLEHLWNQIQDLQNNNWDECLLMRPENAFFDELAAGTKHAVKEFVWPSNFHMTDIPEQEPMFWVFDDSVNTSEKIVSELPSTQKIERFIMDDIALDTIHLLSHNHIECSHFLLNLDKFHKETDYNFHQAIVENLIRELIKLPRSQELSVYYATLLFDLCKGAPSKVPSAMGRSLRIIFSRMDSEGSGVGGGMDVECVRRFGEWFAHHLSNFNYTWKWADWSHTLEDDSTAKFSFIRETLEREIRLSYFDRIVGTLPENFSSNAAVFPAVAPNSNFRYAAGFKSADVFGRGEVDSNLDVLIERLSRQLSTKLDNGSIISVLEDMSSHRKSTYNASDMAVEGFGGPPGSSWENDTVVRDIFVQNILFLGTKSFSHFLNIVERYVKILQQLNQEAEDRLHTVRIIAEFWKFNTQNMEIVLDKLMNYRVVDPISIITWALDLSVLDTDYSRFYVWTILRNVLFKVNSKVSQLREKIGINAMDEDNSSTQEALDKALRDQRAAFILLFQRFQICLQQLLDRGEVPESSSRWRWISGQMREFGRSFHIDVNRLKFTLEATAFVEPIEPRMLKIWNEIKAVGELLVKSG
ncbi:Component of the cap-binding complex (CBC) [Chytriomyces hyalinus]|nr:Component of the cap-binding complex (CBC) [Chytriomyces hyalinus]